jgi:hypothetical protein
MKTTQAQFKHFQGRVKHWAGKYGLQHAMVHIVLEENEDDDSEGETMAWALYDPESSIARIGLSSFLDNSVTYATIDRMAFHEVWEVLLWPMREMLGSRGYSFQQINAVLHDIIRRAETEKFGF